MGPTQQLLFSSAELLLARFDPLHPEGNRKWINVCNQAAHGSEQAGESRGRVCPSALSPHLKLCPTCEGPPVTAGSDLCRPAQVMCPTAATTKTPGAVTHDPPAAETPTRFCFNLDPFLFRLQTSFWLRSDSSSVKTHLRCLVQNLTVSSAGPWTSSPPPVSL